MRIIRHLYQGTVVWGVALALSGVAPVVKAQNAEPQERREDITRGQLATFDQFLDSHPDIAKQLEANPALINNPEFLEAHPQLQAFLNQHPELREELKENPAQFMKREKRFDAREEQRDRDRDEDRDRDRDRGRDEDMTRRQVAVFDQFLDTHPDIAKQLAANPSLVNNPEFLKSHPDLQAFLSSHPELAEELKENPAVFMRQEKRFDAREARGDRDRDEDRDRDRDRGRDEDMTRGQVATFDQFLDSHPDIAKQLMANPSLINNPEFLENHPQLVAFLRQHPEMTEELKENPALFMRQEKRFDAREARRGNPDLTEDESAALDKFLATHKGIAKKLRDNPALVNDEDFLKHNKTLQAFLEKNPPVRTALRKNPSLVAQARIEQKANREKHTKTKPPIEKKQNLQPNHPH